MNQLREFFQGIFDTDRWPARWHCGDWSDFHGWLYIVSDLLIWLAYFLIPVIIVDYFLKKKRAVRFQKIYLLFAAFILLCGSTHFIDAMMFWVPMYRFSALIRFLTAIVSLLTVYYLIRILPEAFRQKTNLELEIEVSRRKEAEYALEEANKNLQAFAYVASHDLQEPLRKILLYSSMLYEKNESVYDPKSRELSQKIIASADRLKDMTRGILNLSVLKEEVSMQIVPLVEAINLALADLETPISEKKAVIRIDPLPNLSGNLSYLSQLFLNLIGNALKFSGKIPVISITAEQFDNKNVIKIADNGIGITDAGKEKIFSAFERLNEKTAYEGSGIGLAICQRIVEIHKGRIYVEDNPDGGSVFVVELPLSGFSLSK